LHAKKADFMGSIRRQSLLQDFPPKILHAEKADFMGSIRRQSLLQDFPPKILHAKKADFTPLGRFNLHWGKHQEVFDFVPSVPAVRSW
jgi:hypothetical protein